MATDQDDTRLRRYLLGELADEDSASLEQDYFTRDELFDRVWAAEHDLVDDYLDGRLSAPDRERFERHYLATPDHYTRVAVARELRAASGVRSPGRIAVASPQRWTTAVGTWLGTRQSWTAAFAAAAIMLAAGGLWMLRSRPAPAAVEVNAPPAHARPTDTPAPATETAREGRPESRGAPVSARTTPVVALSLSPVTVRGADEPPNLVMPPGINSVVLHLESDAGARVFGGGRAVVRTVSGSEVWRGSAPAERGPQPAALSRLEIPADRLTPDDYIVVLFETDSNGREAERYRYFLRVRAR